MSTLYQDIKFGIRMLAKNPGFTVIAVLILGLGIGVNTAIFQLVDVVRLRTIPVINPHELVGLDYTETSDLWGRYESQYPSFSYPVWKEIREHQQAFSGIFSWSNTVFNLEQGGERRFAEGLWVSGDFFNVLGVQPLLGRIFTNTDDQVGETPTAVISYSFWQSEYGGEPSIIGQTISLEDVETVIIGVTSPGFYGLEIGRSFDVAVPVTLRNLYVDPSRNYIEDGAAYWLTIMGRLKPEWKIEQAESHFATLAAGIFENTLPSDYPSDEVENYLNFGLVTFPAESGVSGIRNEYSNPLWLLMALAGFVLLIASANLANLMLARSSTREQETAVRLAVGASRKRLIQQLLTESLLLSAAGACLGLLLSQYFIQLLISMLTVQASNLFLDIQTNWRIVTFTTSVAVLTCLLFGLLPAIQNSKTSPANSLKSNIRSATSSRQKMGMRRFLVVTQIALSLILLISAFLFTNSLQNLLNEDTGFKKDNILVAYLNLTKLDLPEERIPIFKQNMIEKLEAVPGINSSAHVSIIPISGSTWIDRVWLDGGNVSEYFRPFFNNVDSNYFATIGTTFLTGRNFDNRDTQTSVKVAIINEEFAEQFDEDVNPVGKRFFMRGYGDEPIESYEIVGVVNNTKYRSLDEEFRPLAFFPRSQSGNTGLDYKIIIKGDIPIQLLTASVTQTLHNIDPNIQFNFRVLENMIMNTLIREQVLATLSGFFGILATLLASIGLYGVISFMVINRRNEIGIRMALGANKRRISIMVLREAMVLLIVGLFVGSFLSFLLGTTIQSLLFGLSPTNITTYTFAAALLTLVVLIASYIPAWRASRIEPMQALRCE